MPSTAPVRENAVCAARVGVLVAALIGGFAVSVASATPGGNAIANPGFESPLPAPITSCSQTLRASVGVWRAYGQTRGYVPFATTETDHSGKHSVNAQGPARGACAAYAVYQDLPTGLLLANQSFKFSFWMKPELGSQTQEVIYGWRGEPTDTAVFALSEDLSQKSVTISAWGTTKLIRHALARNRWHHVQLGVDGQTNTAALSIDGKRVGVTPAGSSFPAGRATVYLGQNHSATTSGSNFFYDDVAVTY